MRRQAAVWLTLAACQDTDIDPPSADITVRSDSGSAAIDASISPIDASVETSADAAEDAGPNPFATPVYCTSQRMRATTESEGPGMMPGYACNACHIDTNAAEQSDAPIFTIAGTVYTSGHEPDGCLSPAARGAQIVVTDATGAVHTAEVEESGNFSLEDEVLVPPFNAKIVFEGRERAMLLKQVDGDCNSCHTSKGANAAPGRLVLP